MPSLPHYVTRTLVSEICRCYVLLSPEHLYQKYVTARSLCYHSTSHMSLLCHCYQNTFISNMTVLCPFLTSISSISLLRPSVTRRLVSAIYHSYAPLLTLVSAIYSYHCYVPLLALVSAIYHSYAPPC